MLIGAGATANTTATIINDVSRLNPVEVSQYYKPSELTALTQILKKAKLANKPITISGSRHSQGSQIANSESIHIDMRNYNKVLDLDLSNKRIRVQSGATWEAVQAAINPHGLAVKVMQSSGIFTVGGSLSANCHGRDPRFGPISDTVISLRLLAADGQIKELSWGKNEELLRAVLGGYGLLGIILDVDLILTDNELYTQDTKAISIGDYANFVNTELRDTSTIGLHYGRLSIAPNTLLNDMHMTNFKVIQNESVKHPLKNESYVRRNMFLLDLSRRYSWGKRLRWFLQERAEKNSERKNKAGISRNNAMRPPVRFLEYHSKTDTDILQEYFIPIDSFEAFIDELRALIIKHEINLISITTRYMPENKDAILSYSTKETIAIVLYINQGLSDEAIKRAEVWTQELLEISSAYKGHYYLTYQLYPSKEQFEKQYPSYNQFNEIKKKHDPMLIFRSSFYDRYF